jgi:hypothetical protein
METPNESLTAGKKKYVSAEGGMPRHSLLRIAEYHGYERKDGLKRLGRIIGMASQETSIDFFVKAYIDFQKESTPGQEGLQIYQPYAEMLESQNVNHRDAIYWIVNTKTDPVIYDLFNVFLNCHNSVGGIAQLHIPSDVLDIFTVEDGQPDAELERAFAQLQETGEDAVDARALPGQEGGIKCGNLLEAVHVVAYRYSLTREMQQKIFNCALKKFAQAYGADGDAAQCGAGEQEQNPQASRDDVAKALMRVAKYHGMDSKAGQREMILGLAKKTDSFGTFVMQFVELITKIRADNAAKARIYHPYMEIIRSSDPTNEILALIDRGDSIIMDLFTIFYSTHTKDTHALKR